MLDLFRKPLIRGYVWAQIVVLLLLLVLEVAGYGVGLFDGILARRLTDADPVRGIGGLLRHAPPGPVRLTRGERDATKALIAAAFGATPPIYSELSELRWMYEPRPGSLCDIRGSNVASDPAECNRLASTTPFFAALLDAMHPKTEALFLEEVKGYKGNTVLAAFFVGRSGKPQILFDFSRQAAGQWDLSKGFKLKIHHGGGVTDVSLSHSLSASAPLYQIDDPGVLQRRRGQCGEQQCPAVLHLYGHLPQPARNSVGVDIPANLADVKIDERLERRFDFFAALLGTQPALPAPLPPEPFKIERFGVTKFRTTKLDRAVDALFGQGTRNRVLYSPVGYDVAFGAVYGVKIGDTVFLIWDGGDSFPSLGTDRFVFDLIQGGKPRRLANVNCHGVVCFLPYALEADGASSKLEVRKFIDQSGKPWSEFSEFAALFEPLRRAQ